MDMVWAEAARTCAEHEPDRNAGDRLYCGTVGNYAGPTTLRGSVWNENSAVVRLTRANGRPSRSGSIGFPNRACPRCARCCGCTWQYRNLPCVECREQFSPAIVYPLGE